MSADIKVTRRGLEEVSKLIFDHSEYKLVFTGIGVGDGGLPEGAEVEGLGELVHEVHRCPVESFTRGDDGVIHVSARLATDVLDADLVHRETGVFARDGAGEVFLFAYCNVGDAYDYVPAAGSGRAVYKRVMVSLDVGALATTFRDFPCGDLVSFDALNARINEVIPALIEEGMASVSLPEEDRKKLDFISFTLDGLSNLSNTFMGVDIESHQQSMYSTAIGFKSNVSINATAIGAHSKAEQGSTSIGTNISTSGANSINIGNYSSSNYDAIVIGYTATAYGNSSIAIGYRSYCDRASLAIGYKTIAKEMSSVIGFNASATGNKSVAIGYSASASNESIAIGSEAYCIGYHSTLVGSDFILSPHNTAIISVTDGVKMYGFLGVKKEENKEAEFLIGEFDKLSGSTIRGCSIPISSFISLLKEYGGSSFNL